MRFVALFLVTVVISIGNVAEAQEWEIHKGHAVKGNGTKAPNLFFRNTDAQDVDEFLDLCKEACASGDGDGPRGPCGGFVVNYNKRKSKAKFCAFKQGGSEPYKRPNKDTFLLVAVQEEDEEDSDYHGYVPGHVDHDSHEDVAESDFHGDGTLEKRAPKWEEPDEGGTIGLAPPARAQQNIELRGAPELEPTSSEIALAKGDGGLKFEDLDANGDGVIDREEANKLFDAVDTNGDGVVDEEEFDRLNSLIQASQTR